MLYKQNTGESSCRVVLILKWNDEDVLLQDIKTELIYAMKWDTFFFKHEELAYECNTKDYMGSDLSKILKEIKNDE
jgi:hypothetical protein